MYSSTDVLAAEATVTASTNGTAFALPKEGTRLDGMVARVLFKDATQASGSGVVTFKLQHSETTTSGDFTDLASGGADAITLSTTAQSGEIFIPFRTDKPYIRLVCTVTGGTTPTITYSGDVTFTNP